MTYSRGQWCATLAFALGCGGAEPVSFNVGPEGGTVQLAGGVVEIVVPPGAVSQNVTVSASPTSGPADTRFLGGTAYDVKLAPSVQLAETVTVRVKIPVSAVPLQLQPGSLALFKLVSGAWTVLPTSSVNTSADPIVVSARVTSLSVFGVLGGNVGPAGGLVRLANGRVDIVVPAAALAEPQVLTGAAATTGTFPNSPRLVRGSAFSLAPDGLQFAQPVQVTIRYSPDSIPGGLNNTTLGLHRVVNGAWSRIAGTTTANSAATASISVLGTHGVLGDSTSVPPASCTEPSDFTLISQRDFNAKVENNWTDRGDVNFTIESDATAPVSPTNVGQALYPAGWVGGSGPISTSLNLRTQPWKQLWVSFYVKFSLNWQSHSSGVNKVMFIWIHEQPTVFLNAQGVGGQPASALTPSVNLQENASGANRRAPNLVPSAQIVRGQWHRWDLSLVANIPGQANGIIRWCIDGILVGDYDNADFSAAAQANDWNQIQWNPTWGGSGDQVTSDMTQRMDRIRVSGRL